MCVKGNIPAPYWTPAVTDATVDSCIIYKNTPTYNLLRNSDFKNGTNNWELDNNVIIDTDNILDGRYSIKSSLSGLIYNGYYGARQRLNITLLNKITLSGYAMTNDITQLSSDVIPAYLEVIFFNSNNERITLKYVNINFTDNNKWLYFYNSFNVPENTDYIIVVMFVTKNGTVWFNGIKLENGVNVCPEWTPHASETNNLLLGTKDIDSTYWSQNYKEGWINTNETYNGCTVYKQSVAQGDQWIGWYYNQDFEITEDCTFSLWAKVSTGTCKAMAVTIIPRRDFEDIPISTEWKRIYLYLKAGDKLKLIGNKGIFEFYHFTEAATIYVAGFKLEKERNPNSYWTLNSSEI